MSAAARFGQDLTVATDYERRHFSHFNVALYPPRSSGESADENEFRVGTECTLVRERVVFPLVAGCPGRPGARTTS